MRTDEHTHRRMRTLAALILFSTLAPVWAQAPPSAAPAALFAQSGAKNRIIFDYNEPAPTPAKATPTPAAASVATPAASVAPAATRPPEAPATSLPASTPPEPVSTPGMTSAPPEPAITATPAGTPVPAPESTPAASTPSPLFTPAATPTPTPPLVPVPAIATPVPTPALAAATPSPTPAPIAAAATPAVTATPEGSLPTPEPASAAKSAGVPVERTGEAVDVVSAAENASIPVEPPLGGAGGARKRAPMTASESVTINLVNKLVARGILSQDDAKEMISQAETEAEAARAQTQTDLFAIAQAAAAQAASDQIALSQANAPQTSGDDMRVTYIPEPVKTQIKEEIKMELVSEARRGSFVLGPQIAIPEWVARVRPFLDFRFRYEGDFFPDGNDATGAFPNFNAINTGAPFNVTGNQFAPQFNVDQNRNRFRIRVRFGAELDMGERLTAGVRVATGENNSPVSTNQTVGLANQGQGGNFSKYAIWLDRAYLRYKLGPEPAKPWIRNPDPKATQMPVAKSTGGTDWGVSFFVGRFDNPFFSTQLIWDDDLGFDGIALKAHYEVLNGITPFIVGGVFPVFNTDFNFSSNQPQKFESYDKYLFGGQVGITIKPHRDWNIKVAAAYYYFYNIEGKLSSPYTPQSQSDARATDNSRPSFAQKGNTYFPIRNIVPDASNLFGAINQWQYYGLATEFQVLAVTGRIDYNGFEPVQVSLVGEYIQNLKFNKEDINLVAVNNRGAFDDTLANDIGMFDGSDIGWLVEMRVGMPAFTKAWDWRLAAGYRWIGSDSTVDGFNDSDFGLGGTNMKGYTVSASLAFSRHVWMTLRWMGSDSIAGPQYNVNIIQFDLHSEF